MKEKIQEKAALRSLLRTEMNAMEPQARRESDEALFAAFLTLEALSKGKTVLLFYGIGAEPETGRLIPELFARGLRVCLPRCLPHRQMEAREIQPGSKLILGVWSIPEPAKDCPVVSREALDLILVPNLCCDRKGFRLGQGGGYYDRYLAAYQGKTVSLCRSRFLQDALPREGHDRPIDLILTEGEVLVHHGGE